MKNFALLLVLTLPVLSAGGSLEESLVAIRCDVPGGNPSVGTGFVVAPGNLVVTAQHVVAGLNGKPYENIRARVSPDFKQSVKLRVMKLFSGEKPVRDIAILMPESTLAAPGLSVERKTEPKAGDEVIIGGFPLMHGGVAAWPLFRQGIVASVHFRPDDSPALLLDLNAVSGFSGSPVLLRRNRVIGIISKRIQPFQTADPSPDFSFAVPLSSEDFQKLQ